MGEINSSKVTDEGGLMEGKTFEGIAELGGDDGYCYGVHLLFSADTKGLTGDQLHKEITRQQEVIDYLDEIAEKYTGKKIRIKIEVEEVV